MTAMRAISVRDSAKNQTSSVRGGSSQVSSPGLGLMFWICIGYLFLFLIRPFSNWHWLARLHFERLYALGMIAAVLVCKGKRWLPSTQNKAIIAYLGAIVISALFAYRPATAWNGVYRYFTLVVFYLVILVTTPTERHLRAFVIAYLAIMALYDLLSLREFFFFGRLVWSGGIVRLVGYESTYGGPNEFAMSIAFSVPFALALLKGRSRPAVRLGVLMYLVLSITCVVLTGSRSGLLSFLLALMIPLAFLSFRRKILAGTGLALFLLLTWQVVPADKQARFLTLTGKHMNEGEKWSAEGRWEGRGLKEGLQMMKSNPITGVGIDCSPYYRKENLDGRWLYPHSLYGQLLGELGLLGTLAFTWFIALILKNAVMVQKIVRKNGIPPSSPMAWITFAIPQVVVLLLFAGWASHNADRYNWLWLAALGVVALDGARAKQKDAAQVSLPRQPVGQTPPASALKHPPSGAEKARLRL